MINQYDYEPEVWEQREANVDMEHNHRYDRIRAKHAPEIDEYGETEEFLEELGI